MTSTTVEEIGKVFPMGSAPNQETEFRIRLIVDTDEVINAAVQLRASKRSVAERRKVSKSEAVNAILREALRLEIAEIEKFAADEKPEKKKK